MGLFMTLRCAVPGCGRGSDPYAQEFGATIKAPVGWLVLGVLLPGKNMRECPLCPAHAQEYYWLTEGMRDQAVCPACQRPR